MNDTSSRRRFLASAAIAPLATAAGPGRPIGAKAPRVVAPPGHARRLAGLAGRIMTLGLDQGRHQVEADALNDAYHDHHEASTDRAATTYSSCKCPECTPIWDAYSEAEDLARGLNDLRGDLYMEVQELVKGVPEESGVGPPDLVEVLGLALRPLAVVEAGPHTFTLVGSPAFMESCHHDGWGDTEVVIDL